MPGTAVMTEFEDLPARTEILVREFEPWLSAGTVITAVQRCRDELVRTGVRRGLAIAAEAMARSRLHATLPDPARPAVAGRVRAHPGSTNMSTIFAPTEAPSPSTATGWERFRVLLESQRDDCLRRRELALAEPIASNPDPVAMSRVATLLQTIAEIDDALARIAAGTYGLCVHCEGAIPEERLEFRPFAPSCVTCRQPAR